jgi:hypothetical protein
MAITGQAWAVAPWYRPLRRREGGREPPRDTAAWLRPLPALAPLRTAVVPATYPGPRALLSRTPGSYGFYSVFTAPADRCCIPGGFVVDLGLSCVATVLRLRGLPVRHQQLPGPGRLGPATLRDRTLHPPGCGYRRVGGWVALRFCWLPGLREARPPGVFTATVGYDVFLRASTTSSSRAPWVANSPRPYFAPSGVQVHMRWVTFRVRWAPGPSRSTASGPKCGNFRCIVGNSQAQGASGSQLSEAVPCTLRGAGVGASEIGFPSGCVGFRAFAKHGLRARIRFPCTSSATSRSKSRASLRLYLAPPGVRMRCVGSWVTLRSHWASGPS